MKTHHAGFTLVEAIIAITITGIIGAAVAVFMRGPIDAYSAQSQRAEMVDIADTALRRMARELRLSVPNTARVSGGSLEFLLARAGGRYRFDTADEDCFTVGCIGLVTRGSVVASTGEFVGNRLVIYNQYNNAAGDCSDTNPSAYCGENTALITGTTDGGAVDTITFDIKKFVPENGSDSRRLIIFQGPVTYACDADSGQLLRYARYEISADQQPTPVVPAAFPPAVLATNVDCARTSFVYTPGTYETWGVVGMRLALSRNGETITLYHEAHIDNAP